MIAEIPTRKKRHRFDDLSAEAVYTAVVLFGG